MRSVVRNVIDVMRFTGRAPLQVSETPVTKMKSDDDSRKESVNRKLESEGELKRSPSATSDLGRQTSHYLPHEANQALEGPITVSEFNSTKATARIVRSSRFEVLVCSVVVLNAILLGIEAHVEVSVRRPDRPKVFDNLEITFFIFFVIEAAMRIYAVRWTFFTGPARYFNVLDLSILFLQMVQFISAQFMMRSQHKHSVIGALSALHTLKLIRLVRIARILRQVRELRGLIISILISLRSLLWTFTLLALMIYVFSIFITRLVAETLTNIARSDFHDPKNEEALLKYYGGLGQTMFSMFEALFGGQDWDVLVRPLMEEVSGSIALLYVFYIGFSTLALLNVVTGVFVDNVLECNKKDKDTSSLTMYVTSSPRLKVACMVS